MVGIEPTTSDMQSLKYIDHYIIPGDDIVAYIGDCTSKVVGSIPTIGENLSMNVSLVGARDVLLVVVGRSPTRGKRV
jgi:hypothetical protein